MLRRIACCWVITLCSITLLPAQEKKEAKASELKPSATFQGSVEDRELQKLAESTVVSDAKTFEKIWKEWKVGDKMPEIDFKKEIVLVNTTVGSRINVRPMLSKDGDLKAFGIATRDLRPGFRYLIQVVSRDGVKSVNGKELKD